MSITYALRKEYQANYVGGVIAVGDGSMNVREELEAGDGAITIDETDTMRTTILDAYPALERVDAPSGKLPVGYVDTTGADAEVPMSDLRARAKALGIDSPGRSRDEVVASIADAETTTEG